MAAEAFIQCRVPQATKAALRAAAERQPLYESALLKRMPPPKTARERLAQALLERARYLQRQTPSVATR